MIPVFPVFRSLLLSDKAAIIDLTQDFRYCSDFQFSSLWSWDLDKTTQISILNNCLVLRMRDYLTGKLYCSIVGRGDVRSGAKELLRYSIQGGFDPILKFVPEKIAQQLSGDTFFKVSEDRDNFDYIISVEQILMEDQKKSHRKYLRQFENRFNPEVKILDMTEKLNRDLLIKSARNWTVKKDNNSDQLENEIPAMERLITGVPGDLMVMGIFHGSELAGFSIEELIDSEFATGHFQRINYDYRRVFTFINHHVCKKLNDKGIKYINIQQDAGNMGLREKKLNKYEVAHFVKKYTVEATL